MKHASPGPPIYMIYCGQSPLYHNAMLLLSTDLKGLILISPAGLAPHPPPERIVPRHTLDFRLRLLGRAWDSNYTPQAIARWMGRLAPKHVRGAVNRRFGESCIM